MADIKISALPSATTPLGGTEVLPVVQGGVTSKVSVANLAAASTDGSIPVTKVGGTATLVPYFDATGFMGTDAAFSFNDTTKALTATTFVGALTGNTSGTAAGLSGTPNVSVGTVTASGNVGVNVTPSAWATAIRAIQVGPQSAFRSGDSGFTGASFMSTNVYQAAGNVDKYIATGYASQYSQQGAAHKWELAPSGTAGDSITFSGGGMTLNNTGLAVTGAAAIGKAVGAYQFEVNTDSAGKPGVGGLWTVVSDQRIKKNIIPADLTRCYEIVKTTPLKHFSFAEGVYSDSQVSDKSNLGWIAQDVQKVFPKAVSTKPFTLYPEIPDGFEEYEEQDSKIETVVEDFVTVEIVAGKPTQKKYSKQVEKKILLADDVAVVDESGAAVMVEDQPAVDAVVGIDAVLDADGKVVIPAIPTVESKPTTFKPLTHSVPRMIKKTRPKVRHDVIQDCLDLNSGQMIAAMYGAVQALMTTVEDLTAQVAKLSHPGKPN